MNLAFKIEEVSVGNFGEGAVLDQFGDGEGSQKGILAGRRVKKAFENVGSRIGAGRGKVEGDVFKVSTFP